MFKQLPRDSPDAWVMLAYPAKIIKNGLVEWDELSNSLADPEGGTAPGARLPNGRGPMICYAQNAIFSHFFYSTTPPPLTKSTPPPPLRSTPVSATGIGRNK